MSKAILFLMLVYAVLTMGYDYLPDDVPLNHALICIAHNSPQSAAYGWIYHQQNVNLANQWKAGARGAKVNLMWRKKLTKKEPYIALCHEPDGGNNCQLSVLQRGGRNPNHAYDYFHTFAELLKNNPRDVAILILEDYLENKTEKNGAKAYTEQEVEEKLHDILVRSGLAEYALKLDKKCYSPTFANWPTVGEMRKTNKRLIIFTENLMHANASDILNFWGGTLAKNTHWEYVWTEAIKNHACKMRWNPKNAKVFSIGNSPESSLEKGTLTGFVGSLLPKLGIAHVEEPQDYNFVNSVAIIKQRCDDCQKAGGIPPSILGLDFVDRGKVYQAVKEINVARFPGKIKLN